MSIKILVVTIVISWFNHVLLILVFHPYDIIFLVMMIYKDLGYSISITEKKCLINEGVLDRLKTQISNA